MKDPFIISSIILSLTYLFLLIFSNFYKKKLLNILFLILAIFYLLIISFFDFKFVYMLLKSFIGYIWYPTYLLFVINVIFSILILIYTLLKEKELVIKIINYIIFSLNICIYVIFQRLNINLESFTSIYSHDSIIILRISSLSVIIGLIFIILMKFLRRGNNEK